MTLRTYRPVLVFLNVAIHFLLFPTSTLFAQEIIDGWQVFNTSNSGIPDDHIRDIKIDSKKTLWVATWSGGIGSFDNLYWRNFSPANSGLTSYSVNQIAIDKDDHLWIATNQGGVVHFDRENWQPFTLPDDNTATSIVVTKKGDKLIGTPQNGLFLLDGNGNLTKLWGIESGLQNCVHHVALDNDGNALVSTSQGLFRFKKTYMGGFSTSFEVLRKEHTLQAEMDKLGQIWVNDFETGHLFLYKNGKCERIKDMTNDIQISLNNESQNYTLNAFTIFESGRIVIGTRYFGGLAQYTKHHDYWSPILPPYAGYNLDGGVKCLHEGEKESIWVGTYSKGLMIPIEDKEEPEEDSTSVAIKVKKERQKEATNLLKHRRVVVQDTIYTETTQVELLIWDAQKSDGDVISLIFNGEFLLKEYEVRNAPIRLQLVLDPEKNNKLVMYAHNVGEVPPNTARISILDLNDQEEVELTSDLVNAKSLVIIHDVLKSIEKRKKHKR